MLVPLQATVDSFRTCPLDSHAWKMSCAEPFYSDKRKCKSTSLYISGHIQGKSMRKTRETNSQWEVSPANITRKYTLDFILNLSDLSGHEKIKGTGYLYRVLLSMDSPCSEQSRELSPLWLWPGVMKLGERHAPTIPLTSFRSKTHWVAKHCWPSTPWNMYKHHSKKIQCHQQTLKIPMLENFSARPVQPANFPRSWHGRAWLSGHKRNAFKIPIPTIRAIHKLATAWTATEPQKFG